MRERATKGQARAFLDNIEPADKCVLWPFTKTTKGYGQIRIDGSLRRPHRIVCERFHGPCPPNKTDAAHSCGNRACVNPNHLRWATSLENHADRLLHGTVSRGERHGSSKLTRDQVLAIRVDARSPKTIAADLGISAQNVLCIKARNSWAWL